MTSRVLAVAAFVLLPLVASAGDFRVTLLGSGENYPQTDRLGPSILIEAGDQTLVFDAGRGALQRFYESGASFTDVDGIFFHPPAFRSCHRLSWTMVGWLAF